MVKPKSTDYLSLSLFLICLHAHTFRHTHTFTHTHTCINTHAHREQKRRRKSERERDFVEKKMNLIPSNEWALHPSSHHLSFKPYFNFSTKVSIFRANGLKYFPLILLHLSSTWSTKLPYFFRSTQLHFWEKIFIGNYKF